MKTVKPQEVERPLLTEADAAFDALTPEPRTAPDVLRSLAGARERGRLAHGLVLAGPEGSGKRWVAVRLAQRLSCTAPGDMPCGRCAECRRTDRGLDLDVIVVDLPLNKEGERKSEIPVESVRAVQDRLEMRTAGRRRVVIVDPADKLSIVAQEALLKTLEEPPDGVTLMLLTSRPSFLKPTIRSRAPMHRLVAPSQDAIAAMLRSRRGLDEQQAMLAARLSGGHVREALELDPAAEAESWVHLARSLYEILGSRGESRARDVAVGAAPSKTEGGSRDDVVRFLSLLQRILRDAMTAGARPGGSLLNPAADMAARSLATRLPPEAAARALEAIDDARDDLALYMSPKVALTHLLMTIHGLRAA